MMVSRRYDMLNEHSQQLALNENKWRVLGNYNSHRSRPSYKDAPSKLKFYFTLIIIIRLFLDISAHLVLNS